MEFAEEAQILLFFPRCQRKTNFRFVIQLWKLDVTELTLLLLLLLLLLKGIYENLSSEL